MATVIKDRINAKLLVVTISGLAQNEWSELIDTQSAQSVFITANGADVTAYLPSWNTSTDEWETDGTNARELEYLIATSTAGSIKQADGVTYVGVVPGNYMPPRMQFQNTNAANRNIVLYISYP